MSATIDERVVEMRFDNKHFESNVATSMSTLDKLKQKLNLSGASKGLEEIESASKKVNMSGLGGVVESVSAKFSAMQVIGITALANITNQAINAGKRIAAALTIDPIKSGFQEYETQINSVQTILANTSSKGATIDDVNAALDELNKYADLTIYNFTEMTRNIGTFTAAGVDLKTSVNAIQGIANLAAVSGSTSQQASTAMYQLSQALASGTVKLMDWNSVVNAGMGGEVFQNALKKTSELLGTGAEAAIDAEGSFRESLKTGWLTSEVLTETLRKFTTSGAAEYVANFTGLSKELVDTTLESTDAWGDETDAIDKAAEALANKSGKNKDEIKSVLEMAKTAQDAATKVKTFTQLFDVLKEAAQSGWSQTWRIIIGDFEEAKALITPISDILTGFINRMSDWRNNILEGALTNKFSASWASILEKLSNAGLVNIDGITNPFKKIVDIIDGIGGITKTFDRINDGVNGVTGGFKTAIGTVEYFQDIVDKVWRGEYNRNGDNPDRRDLLTEAGYDYRVVQDLVNLGAGYKLTMDDIIASHQKYGATLQTTAGDTKNVTVATNDSTKSIIGARVAIGELTDEQLKQAGLTEDEISLYRALEKEAKRLGISVSELAEMMSTNDGRTLLIDSFKNIGSSIIGVGKAIKDAWTDIFNPPGLEELSVKLYGAIVSLNRFSEKIRLTDKDTGELNETGKKLQRTFKGIFAVVNIFTTVLGGGLKIAFKVLSSVLNAFDLNILDVTANIGDALVAFRDWLLEGNALAKGFDWLISKLPIVVDKFKEWFNTFKETPAVQKLVNAINAIGDAFRKLTSGEINISEFARSLGENLAKALKSLPEIAIQIGKDFIAGFQNGIGNKVSNIINSIIEFCTNFVDAFKEALGVHSPSWKAYDTAVDFFQGFINGAKEMLKPVLNVLKKIGEGIVKIFKSLWDFITDENDNIEWGKLFAGGIIVSIILVLKQLATAFNGIARTFSGISNLIYNAGKVLKSFSKVLNGIAWDLKAKALLKMAIAIGVLVAAIWVITQIDDIEKLWNAVGVIAVLTIILVALALTMDMLNKASVDFDAKSKTFKASGFQKSLLQIGLAILAVAYVVKLIGDLDPNKAEQGFKGLAAIAAGMIVFLAAIGGISRYSKDVSGIGGMILKLSIAMLLMVYVCKLASRLSAEEMLQGAAFATGFAIFVIEITKVAKSAGNNVSKVGGMIVKLSIAMLLMIGVCKLASMLSAEEMLKGAAFAAGFVIFVGALVKSSKIGKKQQLAKLSGMVLSVSFSLLLMVGICKLVGLLSVEEMLKGAAFVAGFIVLLKNLTTILKIGDKEKMASLTGTILAISAAIAILAGVSIILSFMDTTSLAKGIVAVGLLSTMMTIMIKSLKGAHNVKGAIMMMAIAIGVMAASVVALSFIDTKSLFSAAGAMVIVMSAFALMIRSLKGLRMQKISVKPIIAMVGVIIALTGIVALLSLIDSKSVVPNAISLGILLISLAEALYILSFTGPNVNKAATAAMLMGVVLAEIAFVLGLMRAFDINLSIETALALSTLMLALSAACSIISIIPSAAAINGAIGLAAFVGIMAGVVAALGGLSKIPGFTELLADGGNALGLIGTAIGNFVGGIVGGVISGIGNAVIGLLPQLGIALSAFIVGAQPFIMLASNVDSSVAAGAGYMTAAILLITAADFLAGIAQLLNGGLTFSDLGEQLKQLGTGAVSFFELIEGVDSKAVEAAKNVADMILALSLSELIDTITWLLGGEVDYSNMGENLKTFGDAVVGFSDTVTGKIDTSAVNAAANAGMMLAELNKALPRSGGLLQDLLGEQDFEKFATSCKAFASAMIEINEAVSQEGFVVQSDKIAQLVSAGAKFNELYTALPKRDGLVQELAGEEDLPGFGAACVAFADCMIVINKAVSSDDFVVQSDKLEQLASAGAKFNELYTALPKRGGLVQELAGEEDLPGFGESVVAFVKCMIEINKAVSEEGFSINLDAMEQIKQAGLKMNELQSALPKSGGWWEAVAGSDADKLTVFGENITAFAKAMKKFSKAAEKMESDKIDVAMNAANRIKSLVAELAELDTSGVGAFVGVSFGDSYVDGAVHLIAEAMVAFSDTVADIDTEAVTVAVTEAQKLRKLIAMLVGLDTSGIENFTPQAIADQMKGYADKVAGIDTLTVSSSISSANKLKNFIAGLPGLDTSGIDKFKVDSIASSLKSYSTSLSGTNISAINASIVSANKVKAFVISLSELNTTGVTSFKTAIDQLSTVNITDFVNAFSGASTKMSSAGATMINGLINGMNSKMPLVKSVINNIFSAFSSTIASKIHMFEKAGSTMATRLAAGFSSKKNAVSSAVSSCLDSAASKISDKYNSFYNAGSYLVTGFCNGIKDNSYKAAAKSKAMAEAAVQAAKEVLKINSPSRVFKEIGSGIPEGFSIGIGMLGGEVRKSVAGMASTAINTTRSAMNTVLNVLNSDMDAQPTIRPVIDLSDVKTGARAIDGMFNGIQTIGVRSNLNAINSMMNAKLQNGTNDDIISAINKLNDGLENNRGDTYNFGDFTYDDGSNINDAVQTLVRAAKMGRRV